ncbi:c-type cytochrome [Thioalkalivibrio sp. HK1]|uniref:c-type cytochrome n=1 Tax=Thioalkalivibrio sp. HK1 TaxID=1469245 RepID=UPI000470729F|nr:c-type cytochrome [Thioalkalivibrio sp. HK1]
MTLNAAAIVVLAAFGAGGVQSAHAQDADAGRIKARMCQTCHGLDGIAKIPLAPHIAGESEIYLRTRLEAYRSGDMEHEMMSLIAKPLSDEDIADLAAWYASVRIDAQIPE